MTPQELATITASSGITSGTTVSLHLANAMQMDANVLHTFRDGHDVFGLVVHPYVGEDLDDTQTIHVPASTILMIATQTERD